MKPKTKESNDSMNFFLLKDENVLKGNSFRSLKEAVLRNKDNPNAILLVNGEEVKDFSLLGSTDKPLNWEIIFDSGNNKYQNFIKSLIENRSSKLYEEVLEGTQIVSKGLNKKMAILKENFEKSKIFETPKIPEIFKSDFFTSIKPNNLAQREKSPVFKSKFGPSNKGTPKLQKAVSMQVDIKDIKNEMIAKEEAFTKRKVGENEVIVPPTVVLLPNLRKTVYSTGTIMPFQITSIEKEDIIEQNFFEQMENDLTCIICKEVLYAPVMCTNCQNTFCKKCMEKWNKKDKSCPYKCKNFQLVDNRFARNALSKFRYKCRNNCGQILSYDDLENHYLKNCKKIGKKLEKNE